MPTIPLFDMPDVVAMRVRITNSGDGLSEALKVAPRAMQHGEEVSFVLRGTVTNIALPADKDGDITVVYTVKASAITEVDQDTADKLLRLAAEELERARAEAAGQLPLEESQDAEA